MTHDFTLAELTISQTAARRGLNNQPPPEAVVELERLARLVLQPLRDVVGRPVVVSSGYRSDAVNRAVGGAPDSAHRYGRAADIIVRGLSVPAVCAAIVRANLPFDQVIDEFQSWTHVAIAPVGVAPRRQQLSALRAANGRTVFAPTTFL